MSRKFKNRQTELRLERALQTMAIVIENYGDSYWPIFESLQSLLEAEHVKRDLLSKYRHNGSGITNRPQTKAHSVAKQSSNLASNLVYLRPEIERPRKH